MANLEKPAEETVHAGWSEADLRANVVRLAFGGDPRRFEEFCTVLAAALPPDTAAVGREIGRAHV